MVSGSKLVEYSWVFYFSISELSSSKSLLLDKDAEFDAKPELEIYADDVKCSHGSTSGNLDENSIFYLMSRGLSYKQSKKLLVDGFLNDAIEKITNQDVKKYIKKLMKI